MKKLTYEQQCKFADDFIKKYGKESAYDITTTILHKLKRMGFCIWQTYTKDDIKSNLGKKRLTSKEMQKISYQLENFFSLYYEV
mgnify:CR=1 FL=1